MKGTLKFKFIPSGDGKASRIQKRCRLHQVDADCVAEALAAFIKELGAAPGASERLAAKIFLLVARRIPSSYTSVKYEEKSTDE